MAPPMMAFASISLIFHLLVILMFKVWQIGVGLWEYLGFIKDKMRVNF